MHEVRLSFYFPFFFQRAVLFSVRGLFFSFIKINPFTYCKFLLSDFLRFSQKFRFGLLFKIFLGM